MEKEKETHGKVQLYLLTPPPSPHPHVTLLSFPSPRWAEPWLSAAEKSWSLTIPTERDAKANLARGNGGPSTFPNLAISSLSLLCVCVCVCASIQSCSAQPSGSSGKALWHQRRHSLPFALIILSLCIFPHVSVVMRKLGETIFSMFLLQLGR